MAVSFVRSMAGPVMNTVPTSTSSTTEKTRMTASIAGPM